MSARLEPKKPKCKIIVNMAKPRQHEREVDTWFKSTLDSRDVLSPLTGGAEKELRDEHNHHIFRHSFPSLHDLYACMHSSLNIIKSLLSEPGCVI